MLVLLLGRVYSTKKRHPKSDIQSAARKWPANNSIVDHARWNSSDSVAAPSPIHLFVWPFWLVFGRFLDGGF